MLDHVCSCVACKWYPEGVVPQERQGEGHVGVRFGQRSNGRTQWRVWLGPQDVTERTTEAFGDRVKGWVLLFSEKPHRCRACGQEACSSLAIGNVRVECVESPDATGVGV